MAAWAITGLSPSLGLAASHREAPITALEREADITDVYAFVNPVTGSSLTAIMCTDPLLEPANGPNYFPFDPDVLYEIHVDNDHDARAEVSFEFRFQTEFRLPAAPVGFVGAGAGIAAPDNSPPPVDPGTPIIPPAITALSGAGSEGIGIRQTYSVRRKAGFFSRTLRPVSGELVAVPSNVGPRTMPDYDSLFAQGVVPLVGGAQVFAGTVDDPFFIDLGAAFDSLNFHIGNPGVGAVDFAPVLTPEQEGADDVNFVADDVSGYNVNCIAIDVPFDQLTRGGAEPTEDFDFRQIGIWATTSRIETSQGFFGFFEERVQVQRMANPLINELLIGTADKNLWSVSEPRYDGDFADQILDPVIVRVGQAALVALGVPPEAVDIPAPPRLDLAPLAFYTSGPEGPFADLLRVDLSVPPTPADAQSRLGGCGGDAGGFPNGRRLADDVTDCFLRVGFGLLVAPDPAAFLPLGDGVNRNDEPFSADFPFLAPAQDGRDSRHIDAGEIGCGPDGDGDGDGDDLCPAAPVPAP